MSVPAQPAVLGALVAVVLLLLVAAGALALAAVRRDRSRQAGLDALLERSRAEVDSLSARLEQLSAEVEAERTAHLEADERRQAEREYVITTLAGHSGAAAPPGGSSAGPVVPARTVRRLEGRLEDRVLGGLASLREEPLGARAVDAVLSVMSLGHGLRRALSADNLDRAAAEAHLARRRSRRTRRLELREARRALRTLRTSPSGDRDVA